MALKFYGNLKLVQRGPQEEMEESVKPFNVLILGLAIWAAMPSSYLFASEPVHAVITGCVKDGIFISESSDFGTHVGRGGYRMSLLIAPGNRLDLTKLEGRRIVVTGDLLPGDSFFVREETLADLGPCNDSGYVSPRTKTFTNPMVGGLALDFCQFWGDGCGQPAADAWCLSQGYERALRYEVQVDAPPTRIIATGQTCDQEFCDRIVAVTCVEMTGGWYRHVQQYAGLGGTP